MAQSRSSIHLAFRLALSVCLLAVSLVAQRTIRPVNRITTVIDDRITVPRPGDRHAMARAEFHVGPASPDTPMERMILELSPDQDQQAALDALLAAQQDPESPDYHRWLTPEEFGNQFGVSETDIARVVTWLQGHGFSVEPVSPARRSIVFSGTAAQVASAFHTEIHIYNVRGERHFANAAAPEIPAAFDAVIQGIASLNDFRSKAMLGGIASLAAPAGIRPAYSASRSTHYIAPADFTTIYNVTPLYASSTDGAGQSIAVAGRSNINLADVQGFRSTFGLPAKDPTIIVNGTNPGIPSDQSEQFEATLDVEWAGVAAQKAGVQFVVSASTNATDGVDLSVQYIVNHNLAPVVTLSFGSCERSMGTSWNQHWNSLWQQAAAQGISALVSSGDSGAAGCDSGSAGSATGGQGVNGLCSSPYSTCVGGTQFNDTANSSPYWSATNASNWASALSYIPEVAWNQSGAAGGSGLWATGGGPSMIYPKPSWQTGPASRPTAIGTFRTSR
jgi:subtilase family serine protease